MFEQILLITLSRILKPDVGSQIKVGASDSGASNSGQGPSLIMAKSLVDENVSEKLVHQAIDIIFYEFDRYNKIISMFGGIDWFTY